jgi:hypothetical protein
VLSVIWRAHWRFTIDSFPFIDKQLVTRAEFFKQPSIAAITPRYMFLIYQLPYILSLATIFKILSTSSINIFQYLFVQRSALEYANEHLACIPVCRRNGI